MCSQSNLGMRLGWCLSTAAVGEPFIPLQSADGGVKGESGTGEDGRELEAQEIWQQKNEEALDEEFQKNLEVRGTPPVVP